MTISTPQREALGQLGERGDQRAIEWFIAARPRPRVRLAPRAGRRGHATFSQLTVAATISGTNTVGDDDPGTGAW